MEGETLHISPKPSCGKIPHCSGGFCSGTKISCSSAQPADRPLWQQCPGHTKHLFTMYGHITPQQLKTREMEICNMHFHMELPVDAIFNAIDELMEPDEYALMPMSSTQAVRSWNRFSAEHCKWENKKCTSERRKRTVHLFLLQCRSTPKRISLSLVELVPTCHPLMIINPPL